MKRSWRWPELVFEILPIVFLAVGMTLAGGLWLGTRITGALALPVWICLVGTYAALMVLKETRGWNLGLLGVFALLVGAVLGRGFPGASATGWATLGLLGGLMTACGAAGLLFESRIRWPVGALWAVSWPYLIGWVVLVLWKSGGRWYGLWAGIGLLLFGGLMIGWFATWRERRSVTSSAFDLYLLTASMGVAVMVLLASRP